MAYKVCFTEARMRIFIEPDGATWKVKAVYYDGPIIQSTDTGDKCILPDVPSAQLSAADVAGILTAIQTCVNKGIDVYKVKNGI